MQPIDFNWGHGPTSFTSPCSGMCHGGMCNGGDCWIVMEGKLDGVFVGIVIFIDHACVGVWCVWATGFFTECGT